MSFQFCPDQILSLTVWYDSSRTLFTGRHPALLFIAVIYILLILLAETSRKLDRKKTFPLVAANLNICQIQMQYYLTVHYDV